MLKKNVASKIQMIFFSGPDPTARHSCLPLRSATHNYVTAKTLASHRPVSAARVRVGRCHGKKKKYIAIPHASFLVFLFFLLLLAFLVFVASIKQLLFDFFYFLFV